MKILHVTPHLGGGVGKAHARISGVLPDTLDQTFVLLEAPRDHRYVDLIEAAGARIVVAEDLCHVARLASAADIVQFEFWNHPRLLECLGRCDFPAMRSVFWSHISGLFKPVIQPGLMQEAGRFVFTTEASLSVPSTGAMREIEPRKFSVINSGFGFADAPRRARPRMGMPIIAYLGTADFVKMHPGFFEVIDRLSGDDIRASVWGDVDPGGEVAARARAMCYPERVQFRGQTDAPALAMSEAEIFFYPLQADHYGTSENALIEAMSLGLAPLVLNNPAEMAIIRDGETGIIAHSIDECVHRCKCCFRHRRCGQVLVKRPLATLRKSGRRRPRRRHSQACGKSCSTSRRGIAISEALLVRRRPIGFSRRSSCRRPRWFSPRENAGTVGLKGRLLILRASSMEMHLS